MKKVFTKSLLASAVLVALPSHANFYSDLIVNTANQAMFGTAPAEGSEQYFSRTATYPIYHNLASGEDSDSETVAEIIAASEDGNTIVYTDSEMERLGLVDITDINAPQGLGFLQLSGEPTSVAVKGDYALVVINTSEDFFNTSGQVDVIDISDAANPTLVHSLPLTGQPDSIAISPSGEFAAVAIENERDEDACADGEGGVYAEAQENEELCDMIGGEMGGLPQYPAGYVSKITMSGEPSAWQVTDISLAGLAFANADDPEAEYVDINAGNLAAITLQENNGMVIVDLETDDVIAHYNAQGVDLDSVDATKDGIINPIENLEDVLREPDAVQWLSDTYVVTANEGDYLGGSRSFTLFDIPGNVQYEAAANLETLAIQSGHFPEERAAKKGIEPEGIETAMINGQNLLFVGSERGNFTAVYRVNDVTQPEFMQLLPTGVGPEGLLAIPSRNLFVVASEKDDAGDGFRSMLSLFEMNATSADYPQITSAGADTLIAWGALSGLSADNTSNGADNNTLYAVHDSFYDHSRIYTVDVSGTPARITQELELSKDGSPVNYDLEGIAQRADGSFWLVSEGKTGSSHNLLIKVGANGQVQEEVQLPSAVQAQQKKYGFEGVDVIGSGDSETVYVAFQREWEDDAEGLVKIGRYTPASDSWSFFYYPIDTAVSGWVGLSELVAEDANTLLLLERDNQQGDAAAIKRIYRVQLDAATEQGQQYPVLTKTLVRDVLADMQAGNGWVVDKVEGMAVTADGNAYLVTDNDGIDDATGETQFLRLGPLSQ